MGDFRAGPQGEVLPHHAQGPPTTRCRRRAVVQVRLSRVESAAALHMTFGQRLRSRFWRDRVEDEVDAELAFHVEMRSREYEARGMTAADAREAAIRRFGNIHRVNATCRSLGRQ